MNLVTIFITGLFTGGLTCLAVQGGLLAATLAQREEDRHTLPIVSFLVAKLFAYTLLGFLLGWFGSLFEFSLPIKTAIQFLVALFMIGTALNLLEVHPIFRYFVIQPPKFLTRLVRNQMSRPKADQPLAEKSKSLFAPILLGAFTVFIPCGTTQAMMALAVASGNPVLGATILFVFVLGTSPLFFTLGYFATKLGSVLHRQTIRFAAATIILLAIYNLEGTLALTGSPYTLANLWKDISCTALTFCTQKVVAGISTHEATITIGQSGYTPNEFVFGAGQPVTLRLVNTGGGGCTQAFTIPKLGIQKVVRPGTSTTIQFTTPNKPQDLAFMCSMGMFRGVFHIVEG